jgi:hypothetical protein
MSVGPVRSTPEVPLAPAKAPAAPPAAPVAGVPVDKVSISRQASPPAAGDADHDGDRR